MSAVAGLLIAALLLAGCAHPSSTTYETGDVGRTIETTQASIVSSRVVKIAGQSNAVGHSRAALWARPAPVWRLKARSWSR